MQTFKRTSCSLWIAGATLFLIPSVGARPQERDVSSQQTSSPLSHDHHLLLYNTHTGERINVVYRRGEAYIPDALAKLDFFLRDHRTGDVRHFDPRLYDILSDLATSVGRPDGEIDIVCGYRTSLDERVSPLSYHGSRKEQPSHSSGSHRFADARH